MKNKKIKAPLAAPYGWLVDDATGFPIRPANWEQWKTALMLGSSFQVDGQEVRLIDRKGVV